jgi:protein-tyrosine phosphatase
VMLKLLAEAELSHHFEIDSAGTAGHHTGERPDSRALSAAKTRGIHLPSRARCFEREDFARFDYVLAMDRHNYDDLLRLAPSEAERSKVHMFLSFTNEFAGPTDVPDPYYGGGAGFEHVLDLCDRACRGFIEHVKKAHAF